MTKSTCCLWLLLGVFAVSTAADERRILLTAHNPEPASLPTLSVWEEHAGKQDRYYRYVAASFPHVPDCITDMWCYESDGIVFSSAKDLGQGQVQMRHSWENRHGEIVTTVTPLTHGLELTARLESGEVDTKTAINPTEYPWLNVCWQLRRAAGFASAPDPYPEFVKRCFIFTKQGRTFLHETERRPIPVRPLTDARNNPPWVQMYLPVSARDKRAEPDGWADYSPDRYVHQVIGAVSRDGKHLAALACGAESMLSQAWHDCMHNNARWLPHASGTGKEWRIRLYVMQNDPDELIKRYQRDFPQVVPYRE